MLVIPVRSVPSQTFNVVLNGQNCTISLYQTGTGLYTDLSVSNKLIIAGVLCRDRTLIVRDVYLGFVGDLFFADMQGTLDPYYNELNDRYMLAYAFPSDL